MLFHLLALVIVAGYSFGMSYLLYWVTDKLIPMRVMPAQEAIGLDISQHGEFLELDPFLQFTGSKAASPDA